MALTGFFLITFLIVHLMGNLLILKGDEGVAFEAYSDFMSHNKLIRIVEIGLFLGFGFHIYYGIRVSRENKKARPQKYAVNKSAENSSWFSRNMIHTGGMIFIFLIMHLKAFFYEHRIVGSQHTMYESTLMAFSNVFITGIYTVFMVLLAFHLIHGFQSAFQSLGLRHNKYTPFIKTIGYLYACIVPALFSLVPIYVYITK